MREVFAMSPMQRLSRLSHRKPWRHNRGECQQRLRDTTETMNPRPLKWHESSSTLYRHAGQSMSQTARIGQFRKLFATLAWSSAEPIEPWTRLRHYPGSAAELRRL